MTITNKQYGNARILREENVNGPLKIRTNWPFFDRFAAVFCDLEWEKALENQGLNLTSVLAD
ncbi:MAG: hypothetical protein AAGA09_01865 [Pseudomonadota bacterium]